VKFTVINVLFFGIVGSLIGGIIPTIISSWEFHDPMMLRIDKIFTAYIIGSLVIGVFPASLAGYIYSRMYKKEFLKKRCVDFWTEIKFGALSSLISMSSSVFVLLVIFSILTYLDGSSSTRQFINAAWLNIVLGGALCIIGVISGALCSNFIREWNQKLSADFHD